MENQHQAEFERLIGEILESRELAQSRKHARLLQVLFGHQYDEAAFVGSALSAEVYGGQASNQPEQPIRTLCQELRNKLWRYSGSDHGQEQRWCCQFPAASARYGYRLRFVDQMALPGTAGAFWQAHRANGKRVVILYSEPLFFRDLKANAVHRWLDVNQDQTTAADAIGELRRKRPEVKETEALHPAFLYIPTGEISARDYLVEWFERTAGIKVSWCASRKEDSSLFSSACPVMVGGPQGNSLMRELLESKRCAKLHYQYDKSRFGVTLLNGSGEKERPLINHLPSENIERNGNKVVFIDNPGSEGVVFGVVTRMPNPYGEGAATMISSYSTAAIEQIAMAFTNDKVLERILAATTWKTGAPFPRFAQALLSVRMGFFKVDAEASEPELVGWHVYNDQGIETSA